MRFREDKDLEISRLIRFKIKLLPNILNRWNRKGKAIIRSSNRLIRKQGNCKISWYGQQKNIKKTKLTRNEKLSKLFSCLQSKTNFLENRILSLKAKLVQANHRITKIIINLSNNTRILKIDSLSLKKIWLSWIDKNNRYTNRIFN